MMYAVLTGDLVGSSQPDSKNQRLMKDALKQSFGLIEGLFGSSGKLPAFDIFRGDSFQGVMQQPVAALEAGILIRAILRKCQPADQQPNWDARIAIGLGEIDYLPENISEGDGPAYRRSGPVLDKLKKDHRMEIRTPWDEVNKELATECALLEAIIAKWTPSQAEVVALLLEGKERKEIGSELDISQAAIHYRVKGSGWTAIETLVTRYQTVISKKSEG